MAKLSISNRFNPTLHRTAVALLLAMALLSGVAEAQHVQAGKTTALRSQSGASPSNPLQFVPVPPCRVVDTRNGQPIQGGTSQSFPIQGGACGIPASAGAYVFTVTVIPNGRLSLLTVYPTGESKGAVTTMVSLDGRIKSDPTIVPAGANGAVSVYASDTTNAVIDIAGYFAPASNSTLALYPLTPCRVADTRGPNGPLGGPYLEGGVVRNFPILEASSCNIPSSAQAYSLNFTAVPHGPLDYLTAWPSGQSQPPTITLTDPTGTVVADAGIVAAGVDGAIAVYPSNDTDLVIDIDGFFAPPGPGGLSLYPTAAPCHAFDSRRSVFDLGFSMMIVAPVALPGNPCGLPSSAQAFVFNATVYPPGALGYLTLWADGDPQPFVSNLNALDGSVTSNMAIVPNLNGRTDAYASNTTLLALDILNYFAP